jgi:hypothetical protein
MEFFFRPTTWGIRVEVSGNKIVTFQLIPGDRAHQSMVYEPSRKKILLYGGEVGI